jgi:hypothetical protein
MPLASPFLNRVLGMPLEIRTDRQFTSAHWRGRSYAQMAHRQRGQKIFIRGTGLRQVRAMKQQLRELARRINMPIIDIAHAAYAEKLAELDLQPLEPDREIFVFEEREAGEVSDNIPGPEDNCDAARAIAACQRDGEICADILGGGNASVTELLAVSRNGRLWSEFWAARHPNPVVRNRLAIALAEHDALRAECAAKAQRQLERKRANGKAN